MNELALFAGTGGGILGGRLLGWRTVCAVEIDAYAASVLIARQNDGILPAFPIWDDVHTFDGKPWRGIIDVVSGGFPCQDISCAGKGGGISGERSGLWKDMARIIGEVRPGYVLVENSPILTSRGLGVVLGDLAALGYDAEWGVLGAINAGAPHLRNRIWIVAHAYIKPRGLSKSSRREGTEIIGSCQDVSDTEGVTVRPGLRERGTRPPDGAEHEPKSGDGDNTIPDPNSNGLSNGVWGNRGGAEEKRSFKGSTTPRCPNSWWRTEPNVGRVANGVATRVDRLKALGEGQVPAVVRIAWRLLR